MLHNGGVGGKLHGSTISQPAFTALPAYTTVRLEVRSGSFATGPNWRPVPACPLYSDRYRNREALKPTRARAWAQIELYGITRPKIAPASARKIELFGKQKYVCKKRGFSTHSIVLASARIELPAARFSARSADRRG
jgi:hypothetical protein